ncbi:MAG: hypothetical protein PWP52_1566 [Bacteroidales bacterium]|nr:hypothetical protein [Bacteroidales bacterium]
MFRLLKHIFISLILMLSITGFAVSKHYCSTELVSIEINKEASQCCDMEENCCYNETDFYQLKNDFFVSTYHLAENLSVQELLFPVIFSFYNADIFSSDSLVLYITESPPNKESQDRLSFLQSYLC